ncbi:response regulator [Synechocystis sp. LKSZ1]|uniref:hybrid sensor histidine kinase/response regulator n=1 Tax=Synechocystis sp. LKSZ1 TaxID=3144951 RepID=UPI00336C263C
MATILIVDDNPSNFDVIDSIFSHENDELYYASSGKQALDLMTTLSVDLVLLDVMMPEMDGVEVCQRIKSNPQWPFIPVVMVTALTDKEELAFCLQAGADDFISKPVNALELRARVRSMLRLKQQFDRLQDNLQMRQDLTHMAIHDLRNPLSTILLASEILEMTPLDEKQKHKVEQIHRNGKQLMGLVDSLLIVAKSEAGALCLNPTPVDINSMAELVIQENTLLANHRGVTLELVLPPESKVVEVDQGLFQRVLDNLIGNAIKFSLGGPVVTLSVEYPTDKHLRIRVSDQGPGITAEGKEQIFHKFETGQFLKQVQQTGIGLALCRLVVEAHGGQIWVEDNQPQGSVFVVEL